MKLENIFRDLKIEEGMFLRNLSIYPVSDGGSSGFSVRTLDEGLSKGDVRVKELSSSRVEEIEVINDSPDRLFFLDGEEIIGALQDRITNTAALVESSSTVRVPVTCIEQGRWEGKKEFRESFLSSHPRLRAILCKGVTESLRRRKSFKGPQKEVWKEVTRKLNSFKISSRTSTLHDVYKGLRDEVERYIEEAEGLRGFNGFIAYAGDKLLGFEYFYDKSMFEKFIPKLLRGYALDGLEIRKPTPLKSLARIKNFIEDIKKIETEDYPSIALGKESRFIKGNLTGRIFLFEEKPLQASIFTLS